MSQAQHARRYLTSMQELQQYAAAMHLLEDFPQAIIVDDLSAFVDARCLPCLRIMLLTGCDKKVVCDPVVAHLPGGR